jgi:predicted porin
MNGKLMAVAVAGALAAPGIAFAQASNVTISGFFKVGWENVYYGNAVPARLNSSQFRVADNGSRMFFNTVEDLGNGLAAVAQLDFRFSPDQASAAPVSNPIGSGDTWVGLRSKTMGTLTAGRSDLHYGKGPSEMTRGAGALQASDVSLFGYVQAGAANVVIANGTRTQNVVRYDTPNWGGFSGTLAWSANPVGNSEADMTNPAAAGGSARKGNGWNINPRYRNGPFEIEYSYWRAKPDAPVAATFNQRGDSLTGKYTIGGLKLGMGWNRSSLDTAVGVGLVGAGTKAAERTTLSVAGQYNWGPNTLFAHYDRASDISTDIGLATSDTGARMLAVVYEYSLSKRTSLGATFARISNDSKASYQLFLSSVFSSNDTVPALGESPRIVQMTILHRF